MMRQSVRVSSPSQLFLQLSTQQEVREEEDVAELPGSLHQLHHEAVLQQLPVLQTPQTTELINTPFRDSVPQTHRRIVVLWALLYIIEGRIYKNAL